MKWVGDHVVAQASDRSPRIYSASAARIPAKNAENRGDRGSSPEMKICNKIIATLLANGHAFNDNVFFWRLVHTTDQLYSVYVYHVHALTTSSKYAVAPTLRAFARRSSVVISHVDEELGG